MQIRATLRPGQRGTRKLCAEYGERLVAVRYCYDEKRGERIKTIELVVDTVDWIPRRQAYSDDAIVPVRIGWHEHELRQRAKLAGARWDRHRQLWLLPYRTARFLGLEDRIVSSKS